MPANGQKAAGEQLNKIFGINSGYSQRTVAAAATATTTAPPPTAAAAPSSASGSLFTGLCEALNQHQQQLVKNGTYEVADQYAIQFAPAVLGAATVTPPGATVYSNTPTQAANSAAAKLDASKNQLNTTSQIWQVLGGTQIVQLIDQVMRGSSYVRDQQKAQISPTDDKQTANAKRNVNPTVWYKISVQATPLKYDNKRRDFAYRMTYVVNTYAINQMVSPYFNDGKYRGAHKAYTYWFTGTNTQILNYEQEYNNAYYITMSQDRGALAQSPPVGRDQMSQTFMATSEVRGQGQPGYTNNPADSAAAFLYNVSDFGQVKMKIVGDPAFLQQGEVATGVNPVTFNFTPFNADGGINYDSSEVVFTVSFNRPTDYNFNTGIMNVNAQNGQPQETFAYRVTGCKNIFSKGQFTQELSGSLITGASPSTTASAAGGRTAITSAIVNGLNSLNSLNSLSNAIGSVRDSKISNAIAENGYDTELDEYTTDSLGNTYKDGTLYSEGPPTTQPAGPPGDPTSDGDIQSLPDTAPPDAGGGGDAPAPDDGAQQIAQDDN
jgi:hypothetical protein